MSSYIEKWDVEDEAFWASTGKKIATRNLWISIPSLLMGFAVWLCWSVVTVQMKNMGFPFDTVQLFTLSAIAGLAGATLRIPNSFLIAIAGGKNVIALTTALLIAPALGLGFALQDINTSFTTFAILAAFSGLGGGNFSSSMSNINFFFPKRMQGMSLGLNAGLGNIGVSVMQVLIPFVVTFGLFGALGGEGLSVNGETFYIQNAGFVWVPILLVLALAAWFGMNSLSTATPNLGSTSSSLLKILGLIGVGGVGAAIGLYLLLGLKLNMWLVLPVTIIATVFMMKAVPGEVKSNLDVQFAIFKNKHNWIMTY
ncbi:MAG: antiporter, partial [Anaerolineae bacterium]|nr:antiporter [Anaerolineae bacterium]